MNDDRGSSQSKSESLSQGVKYDEDKLKYHLVDPFALAWMVATLTYGAVKYEEENWREVRDFDKRYYSALKRHLELWKAGENFDEESGLPHLAQVMFCAMCLTAYNTPRSFKSIHQITSEAIRRAQVLREKRLKAEKKEPKIQGLQVSEKDIDRQNGSLLAEDPITGQKYRFSLQALEDTVALLKTPSKADERTEPRQRDLPTEIHVGIVTEIETAGGVQRTFSVHDTVTGDHREIPHTSFWSEFPGEILAVGQRVELVMSRSSPSRVLGLRSLRPTG